MTFDNWNYPFNQPVATDTPSSQDFDIDVCLVCDYCGEVLEPDDEAVDMMVGKVGESPKSGRPIVVQDPERGVEAILHVDCIHPWMGSEVEEEIEALCAACESKLEGND